jgi:hypothetical protein
MTPIKDKGGRRFGTERRKYLYTSHIPERRSDPERRSGKERRIVPDRRKEMRSPPDVERRRAYV